MRWDTAGLLTWITTTTEASTMPPAAETQAETAPARQRTYRLQRLCDEVRRDHPELDDDAVRAHAIERRRAQLAAAAHLGVQARRNQAAKLHSYEQGRTEILDLLESVVGMVRSWGDHA